jgi:homoserine kinase
VVPDNPACTGQPRVPGSGGGDRVSWPRQAVRVRVPATSANLGPGFDALGLALTLYDEVTAEVTGAGLDIEVSGEGAGVAGAGEGHLVVRAMRAAFAAAGGQPPGLALRCVNAIPQGRGLGSSAGAVVAGLLAGRALAAAWPGGAAELSHGAAELSRGQATAGRATAAGGATAAEGGVAAAEGGVAPVADGAWTGGAVPGGDEAMLALAAGFEGHPDNAAACLAGGLTIAWNPGGGPRAVRLDPLPVITPVVCVPVASLATSAARRALPATIPHADAAANAGRSALLVAALTQAPDLLLDATQDLLHQPYRAPLMPATADLIGRLRGAGIAAVVSGAGPSVLAFTLAGQTPGPGEVDSIAGQAGTQWQVSPLDVDRQGATIQSVPPSAAFRAGARHGRHGNDLYKARCTGASRTGLAAPWPAPLGLTALGPRRSCWPLPAGLLNSSVKHGQL